MYRLYINTKIYVQMVFLKCPGPATRTKLVAVRAAIRRVREEFVTFDSFVNTRLMNDGRVLKSPGAHEANKERGC